MKRVGSVVKGPDLLGALDDFAKAREVRGKGAAKGTAAAPQGAGATVERLEGVRRARRLADAAHLETLARKAGMDTDAAKALADGLRTQTPEGWTFIMLSPSQNAAVVRWLMENSSRPLVAARLWARLFEVIRHDTGEVLASRAELAAHLGVEPDNVSRLMGELASINAIRRERQGRGVRYFMNSTVATHLPGATVRKAAREADGPLLVLMDGGQGRAAR